MTRHARRPWIVLIVLCSLALAVAMTGCGAAQPQALPTAPVLVLPEPCPAPLPPVLPDLDSGLYFDAPANMEALLTRDDIMRQYIKALLATVRCYEAQTQAALPGE